VNGSGKYSSLFDYGNNYGRKKFYSTGPRMVSSLGPLYQGKLTEGEGSVWLTS